MSKETEIEDPYLGILIICLALNMFLCFSVVQADNGVQQMLVVLVVNPIVNIGCLVATGRTYSRNKDYNSQISTGKKAVIWLLPVAYIAVVVLSSVVFPQSGGM